MDKKFKIIYLTKNLVNGKIYIGQHSTNKLEDGYLGSGNVLELAIKKYGRKNFERIILEHCDVAEELSEKERYWIKLYNSNNKQIGYNISGGGEGMVGYVIAEETKEKISKSIKLFNKQHPEKLKELHRKCKELWNTQEKKEFASQRALKQFSDPKQRKMASERARGNNYKAKTYIITFPDGHEETIENLKKFCREWELNKECMCMVASGKQLHHKNFKCRRLGETPIAPILQRDIPKYEIIFPDNSREIITSLSEFCIIHGLKRSAMNLVAQGLRKNHKMFRCRKLDDNNFNYDQSFNPHSYEYEMVFPDGHKEIVKSLSKFCKEHNLTRQAMSEVSNGTRKHHKNFKCKKIGEENVNKRVVNTMFSYKIIFPDNHEEIIHNLSEFCKKHNLCKSVMLRVSGGLINHYRKFKCVKLTKELNNDNLNIINNSEQQTIINN